LLRSLTVSELAAAAPTVREDLISFMAAFDPTMFEVRYSTPRGEPLHPFLPSSYVEARVSPEFMLRLVNVEGVLGLLQRASEAPLVLEVEDDEIPENVASTPSGAPLATWSGRPDGGADDARRAPTRAALRRLPPGAATRPWRTHQTGFGEGCGASRRFLPARRPVALPAGQFLEPSAKGLWRAVGSVERALWRRHSTLY
jgi:Acetyltransferase (GNAT) domain